MRKNDLGWNIGERLGPVIPVCLLIEKEGIEISDEELQSMAADSTSIVFMADKQRIQLLMFHKDVRMVAFYEEPIVSIDNSMQRNRNSKRIELTYSYSSLPICVSNGAVVSVYTLSGQLIIHKTINEATTLFFLLKSVDVVRGFNIINIKTPGGENSSFKMMLAGRM